MIPDNEYMLTRSFVRKMNEVIPGFSPKVILDIGSRDAEQSVEFARTYPEANVYAFEPNPQQYEICCSRVNDFDKITMYNLALSDKRGDLDFYVTHGNVGASSLLKPLDVPFGHTNDFSVIKVKCMTIDDWCKLESVGQIDVMWMDVQGVELNVLRSMNKDVLSKVKFIHCEASESPYYEGHSLKAELQSFLNENGFKTTFSSPAYHPYGEGDILAINGAL